MSVKSKFLKNTQNSFQLFSNKKILQKGGCNGSGRSVTMTSLNNDASNGMGYNRAAGVPYVHCDQKGGGYGFDSKSAGTSSAFRGSYPNYSTYQKSNQCGGKRRRKKRKTLKKRRKYKGGCGKKYKHKHRKKSRKNKRKKSRRKKRKSKKRRGGKRKKSRKKRKTGTLITLASPQMGGSTVSYSLGSSNPQKPWALSNNSYELNEKSCFDNYNHFKKN